MRNAGIGEARHVSEQANLLLTAAPAGGLVAALAERAEASPEATAYEFVDADGTVETLTYGALGARAAAFAGSILAQQEPDRVRPALLLYPPGLEYVVAVHACLLAGVPAVPAYPPEPWRPDAGLGRLTRIADDLGLAIVLADELVSNGLEALGATHLRPMRVGDDAPPLELDAAGPPRADEVALVQYTSGSTSAPRGVVVRHRNLEHNMRAIGAYFGIDTETRGLIWLPPYHDMGLIGGILTPLFFGFPVRLMSPLDFLKRPLFWLRQISDFRATISGGPNFAYDLCVRRRVSEEELEALDLSSWRLAFNGAEPVRRRTMEAFADRFAPAGFERGAFFPCYGLAEATLIVSGRHWDGEVADGEGRVSCGPPLPDQELRVVDPASGRPVAEGAEGELWLRGASVSDGYWNESASEGLFGELEGRRFLRTGDLGYLAEGELVVSGRVKDVLVYRGVNYHAADVEEAAVTDAPGLRPLAAAFMVEGEGEPQTVVVVEARPQAGEPSEVGAGVRERVLAATGLALTTVVVGPPGTVPRTSSGKVQRALCRRRFAAGEYAELVAHGAGAGASGTVSAAERDLLVGVVCGVFAAVCEADSCEPEQTLYELGGDSLRAAEIAEILESALDFEVPVDLVLETLTPAALAEALLARVRGDGAELRERLEQVARSEPAGASRP